MTHQEYTAAIAKQQTLINRLFKCRDERSKKIQQITEERYANLIGKFFKANERLKHAMCGDYYYIVGVTTCSNYIDSNEVVVRLCCKSFGTRQQHSDDGWKITGIDFSADVFRFEPTDDIETLIAPMIVSKDEAMSYIEDLNKQMMENFLSLNFQK